MEPIPHYVYIIRCDAYPSYKIGIAKNIEERVYGLQLGCPFALHVVDSKRMDDRRTASKKEIELHDYFVKNEIGREWYSLNDKEIKMAKMLLNR